MVTKSKKPRAFVIGDRDGGLVIVVTDPVMVVHYAAEDWKSTKGTTGGEDTEALRAAVVEDLVTTLRGVDLSALKARDTEVRNDPSSYSKEEIAGTFDEIDHARTIARLVRAKTSIVDVDFCLAFDTDAIDTSRWPRIVDNPAAGVRDYLHWHEGSKKPDETTSTTPRVFDLKHLRIGDTNPLPPLQLEGDESTDPSET